MMSGGLLDVIRLAVKPSGNSRSESITSMKSCHCRFVGSSPISSKYAISSKLKRCVAASSPNSRS